MVLKLCDPQLSFIILAYKLTLLSTLQADRLSIFYVSGLGHKALVAHTENIFVHLCIYGWDPLLYVINT